MQQSKALQAADANPKRPGSATTNLDTLDLTQKKLDARVSKLSKEMNHKLDNVMKMVEQCMQNMANANASRAAGGWESSAGEEDEEEEKYYTIDSTTGKRRFSNESIQSNTSSERPNSGGGKDSSGYNRIRATSSQETDTVTAPELSESQRQQPKKSQQATAAAQQEQKDQQQQQRSEIKPSSSGKSGREGRESFAAPEKAKSLSIIMASPGGILRKRLEGGETGSQKKKRHSFSSTIATVHVIGEATAGPNGGSPSGKDKGKQEKVNKNKLRKELLSDDEEGDDEDNDGDSLRTDSEDSDMDREGGGGSSKKGASALGVINEDFTPPVDADMATAERKTSVAQEEHEQKDVRLSTISLKVDSQSSLTEAEAGKLSPTADAEDVFDEEGDEEGALKFRMASGSRSPGTPTQYTGSGGGGDSSSDAIDPGVDADLDEHKGDVVRVKPKAPLLHLSPSPLFRPKRINVVLDRATISGPPIALAINAVNDLEERMARIRAASAGTKRNDKDK